MAYADVEAKTKVNAAFSAADKTTILGAIKTAYDGSATAKSMFDTWVGAGKEITINKVAGVFQAYLNTGKLEIDLNYLTNANYVSPKGKAVQDTAVTAIVHELGHALSGKTDDITTSDYKGPTVDFVNKIYKELGLAEQISYTAYDSSGNVLKRNYDYTNGAAIDVSVTKNKDINTSVNPTATKDLLVGGPSANKLISGDGDDFLFGGGGDDTLKGGAGKDTAVYFDDPLDYDIRKNADGSWTVRDVRGAKNDGTDALTNVEVIQFGDKTYELKKKGLTFQTDFALVIDTTGSMGSSIGAVKGQASALINAAFADGKADARIGVVGFKDETFGEPTQVFLKFTDQDDFAARKSAALNAINSIGVGGGGDLPETAFAGLMAALDGRMGDWRPGAGIMRVALFTDAPAKDGALAGAVSALAHNIGATLTAASTLTGARGAVDTFDLTFPAAAARDTEGNELPFVDTPDDPIDPDTSTAQIQIFTIFTGPAGSDTAALGEIAEANDGNFLTAPDNESLIDALFKIISAPPGSEDEDADDDLSGLVGTPGADVLKGTSAGDTIAGIGGDDKIDGLAGNDKLAGGAGNDDINGGLGDDTLTGGSGNDKLAGGVGIDNLDGGSGNDVLGGGNGDDQLDGKSGNDTLNGGNGNDQMLGGDGADTLNGGNGADMLEGNAGADMLNGGNLSDTFVFRAGFGADTVSDFRVTGLQHDILQFDTGLFADATGLFAHSHDTADGLLITSDLGDTLLIKNATMAALQAHPEDLHFV